MFLSNLFFAGVLLMAWSGLEKAFQAVLDTVPLIIGIGCIIGVVVVYVVSIIRGLDRSAT